MMSSGSCFSLCVSRLFSDRSFPHGGKWHCTSRLWSSAFQVQWAKERVCPGSYTSPTPHSLWMRLSHMPLPSRSYQGMGLTPSPEPITVAVGGMEREAMC